MIPFVKLYTRQFHLTSKIFLRKITPKISSKDYKHELSESNFDVSSSCQSSCSDYLGIESDDNVITVKPQTYRFQQTQKSDTREKFYRASFGVVRLDADNKLKYHGQYKRKKDFSFPHSSSEIVQVRDISQAQVYENEIVQCLPLKDFQAASTVDTFDTKNNEPSSFKEKDHGINYIDECYFGASEMNVLAQDEMQETTPEKLNIIEKDYFETLVNSKNPYFRQDTSKNADSEQNNDSIFSNKNQAEEFNFFEKKFFETLNNSENLHVEQDSTEYSDLKKTDYNLSSKDNSEELNYLEKGYFGDFPVKQDISDCIDNALKINSAFDTKNQDTFFKNNNPTTAVDELSDINKSLHEKCSLTKDQNSAYYDDLLKSSTYFVEDNNIINNDIYNNLNEINHDNETKNQNKIPDSEFNNYNVNELKKLNQKQTHEINFKKLSSYKTQKSDTISHENAGPSVKNLNIDKELSNESIKQFSKENNLKFSELVSEKPNQNIEIATAHDFVRKLREERNINISKREKSTTEDKFDSKGFRILRNQVPNLSYFTHDEILDILKKNIVYSDDDLLVLNKPYSLVIHESKTTKEPCLSTFLEELAKELDKQSINPKLFTVHRLDKETTGCLLLARNETMAMHLKALFAQRKIVKKYWVITSGVPDPPEGVIDMPISEGSINDRKRMVLHPKLPSDVLYKSHSKNGKPAVTTYKVISESGNAALVEVFPKTGVKHQIRVHFGFGLGCPILGDHKYSHLDKLAPQTLPSDMLQRLHVRQSKVRHIPMHIHAKSVGIPEYFDKRDLFVNIPIPDHFKINLKRLKFRKKNMIY